MGRNKDKGRKGKSRLNRIISSDLGTPGYTTNAVYSQKVLPDLSVINELKRNLTASKSAEMEVEHELHKKYKVRGLLGNGAFGKVEKVEDLESGTTEARKVFDLCGSSTKKKGKNEKSENGIEKKKILAKKLKENQRLRDKVLEELENISQELKVWSELSDCDYIVELFGWEVLERDRIVHIYMESCECSLAHRKLSIPEMKVTLSCILLALNHLHTRNFVHLDLKPDNLLIARNGTVKLCDFGVSVNTKTQLPLEIFDNLRFTPAFVSPEVLWHHLDLQGEKFSNDNAAINYKKAAENLHKCDIWSLGVCLLELAINANPFLVCSQNTLRDKFAAAEKLDELDKADSYVEVLLDDAKNDSFIILPDEADTNMRFTFKTAWKEFIRSKPDYDFMEFVRLCLVIDCELRPDVKELMKDKFVKASVKTLSVSIDSEDEALRREKNEMLEVMKKFLERNNISKDKDNNRKSVFLKILKFFTQSKMKKSMRSNKNEQLTLLKLGTSL